MKKTILLLTLLTFFSFNATAQEKVNFKMPNNDQMEDDRYCGRFSSIFRNAPKEVSFGVNKTKDWLLYFNFNDREWFEGLLKNPRDGIAIDIVKKKDFECGIESPNGNILGQTLGPIYANVLKRSVEEVQKGHYRVQIGQLPNDLNHEEIEYNILFINNGFLCRYQKTYHIESFNLELLEMGLYTDSIPQPDVWPISSASDTTYLKKLRFEIPFKKNKSNFSQSDIKPLYDSLRLTDFTIKKIDIKAFSSVEGNAEKNRQLQKARSQSIVDALQAFQNPSIETTITTSENWVEFLNDIKGTEYDPMRQLSKAEIRDRLTGSLSNKLEPFLETHRKALITLFLEKTDVYSDFTSENLVRKFNLALEKDSILLAKKLQSTLFDRIRLKTTDPNILDGLEIPKQKKFVDFFNANSAFRYEVARTDLMSAYYEFEELYSWNPDNKKVLYNLISLKLKIAYMFDSLPIKPNLLEMMKQLETMGIETNLLVRMHINYHIVKSKVNMLDGDYVAKDDSVMFIIDKYDKIKLSDDDLLCLAQYVTHYFDTRSAIALIDDRARQVNVDKRLLFYYLNLTIHSEQYTNDWDYRTVMLNALEIDGVRFCKMFNSIENGGVTFQLLSNDYLKNTYCENCKK